MFAVIAGSSETLRPLLICGCGGVCGGDVISHGHLHHLLLSALAGISDISGKSVIAIFLALFLAVVEILAMLVNSRLGKRQLFLFDIESDGALGCLF